MQKEEPSLIPGPGKGMAAGRGMPLGAGTFSQEPKCVVSWNAQQWRIGAPGAMAARPMAYARPPPGFPAGVPGLPPGMPPGFPPAGGLPPGMPPAG